MISLVQHGIFRTLNTEHRNPSGLTSSQAVPCRWPPENHAFLAAFNARWEPRFAGFCHRAGAPWWAPGLVLTPEVHRRYEMWLSQAEYRRNLTALAARLLPGRAWTPHLLRTPDAVLSLPDLWQRLPPALAGLANLDPALCGTLLCALADPPQFGTDTGRYPEQLRQVTERFAARPEMTWRVLDLGCGTGQGTWEVAQFAAKANVRAHLLGITREPLEAWMATHRRLPHDPVRERRYPCLPSTTAGRIQLQFVAADGLAAPLRPGVWDLILVNGLAGGPHLKTPDSMQRLLHGLAGLLAPGGAVGCACRFHDGYAPHLDVFAALARANGWRVSGPARQLWLGLPAGQSSDALAPPR